MNMRQQTRPLSEQAESNGRVATKKGRGQDAAAKRDKEASENLLSFNLLSWPQGHWLPFHLTFNFLFSLLTFPGLSSPTFNLRLESHRLTGCPWASHHNYEDLSLYFPTKALNHHAFLIELREMKPRVEVRHQKKNFSGWLWNPTYHVKCYCDIFEKA